MAKITVRLMQEDGVSGPLATIECEEGREAQEQAARDWADAQTGHPWDVLTVETEDGHCFEVEQ